MHFYCINETGREGVNTRGDQGVKCAPGECFLTVWGIDVLKEKRDLCFSLAETQDLFLLL